jgi:hypothetical protein
MLNVMLKSTRGKRMKIGIRGCARCVLIHAALMTGVAMALATAPVGAAEPAQAAAPAPGDIVVRQELVGPLQAAQEQMRKNDFAAAVATLKPLRARADIVPLERYVIERHIAIAQLKAGAYAESFEAFESMLRTDAGAASDRRDLLEMMVPWALKQKEYGRAAQWADELFAAYADAQPPIVAKDNVRMHRLHAHYFAGHYEKAGKLAREWVTQLAASGGKPSKDLLELEGSVYIKSKDAKGYVQVLEDLIAWYPKPEYWADLISRAVVARDDYQADLDIEVLRLKRVVGAAMDTSEYIDYANLALQSTYPLEAKAVLEKGLSVPDTSANDAAAMRKLLAVAEKQIGEDRKLAATPEKVLASAKDGQPLVNVGLNNVFMGQLDQGLRMMQQGIAKGIAKHPSEARLRLAYASVLADRKAEAAEALKGVDSGSAGALGRIWLKWLGAPAGQ